MHTDIIEAAEHFMWLHARVIDRLRFEHHFKGARPEPVLQALRAYQTDDGGFGHALEPDCRGPMAMPLPVWTALEIIDELGLAKDSGAREMVHRAVDWTESITLADGGVPFVLPSIAGVPHAPWLQPEERPSGSLLMTGLFADALRRLGVHGKWLERASEFCWAAIERLDDPHPYEARAALAFVNTAPDRSRAEQAFERIAAVVRKRRLVTLDAGRAVGESHAPLDFAPRPDAMARRLFDDATMERQLDALLAAQQPDGGWTFDWTIWTPIVKPEWRGVQTIRRLLTLRAYGRLR